MLPSAAEIVDDAEPEAAAESIELAAAEPEPTPIATALGLRSGAWSNEPFVEIGTFSSEENAKDAAATMREDGILPTIRTKEANGTTLWRVVAGPAQTRMERSALLRKVKRLGFEDAYTVAE
ncbi:MAG: SPOR domain-containing protein [Pseudomonadota bacterium]